MVFKVTTNDWAVWTPTTIRQGKSAELDVRKSTGKQGNSSSMCNILQYYTVTHFFTLISSIAHAPVNFRKRKRLTAKEKEENAYEELAHKKQELVELQIQHQRVELQLLEEDHRLKIQLLREQHELIKKQHELNCQMQMEKHEQEKIQRALAIELLQIQAAKKM